MPSRLSSSRVGAPQDVFHVGAAHALAHELVERSRVGQLVPVFAPVVAEVLGPLGGLNPVPGNSR
jgi:hypothetical protein